MTDRPEHGWETLPDYLARTHPDGPPPGLIPVRLCPVQVFGADQCDRCEAPAGYGLMDAVTAWSDCNRAYGKIYRRDDDWSMRAEGHTILVWVTPEEAEKFDRVLGDLEVNRAPHVTRYEVPEYQVRVEATAFLAPNPDLDYIEQPIPIPNDSPECECRIEMDGLTVLGVRTDPKCPFHGWFARARGED